MNKKIMLVYSTIHFIVDFSCAIFVTNIVIPQSTDSFSLSVLLGFFTIFSNSYI